MKKLALLFVSVLTLSLLSSSCGSDDDEASIEGSWEFIKYGEIVDGEEVLYPYENSCSSANDYSEIMSNGTLKDYYYDEDCLETIDNGTWTKNGNTLTFTYSPDDITVLEIVKLTSSKLKVKFYDEDEQTYYLAELQKK